MLRGHNISLFITNINITSPRRVYSDPVNILFQFSIFLILPFLQGPSLLYYVFSILTPILFITLKPSCKPGQVKLSCQGREGVLVLSLRAFALAIRS